MPTAADRGWPVGQVQKADLYLVSSPEPTAVQRLSGVLTVPGFHVWVHREVGPMFRRLLRELQALRRARGLPELTSGGGNAFRAVRGYEDEWEQTHDPRYLSNHAFALAVDLSVPTNPMGRPIRSDFPRDETYRIAASCGLDWGREWDRPDPQHFEWTRHRRETASWREKVEDTMNQAQEDLLREVHKELTQRLPSRVDGSTSASADTLLGHVLNADKAAYLALQEVRSLARTLDRLRTAIDALPGNVRDVVLGTVVEADTWRDGAVVEEPTTVRQLLARSSEASIGRHRQELALPAPLVAQKSPVETGTRPSA